MVKVFVLGATGFIGFPAALALRRAGHIVYGLARSESKTKFLRRDEIIPVIGDADNGDTTWKSTAAQSDVVVDIADGQFSKSIFKTVLAAAKSRPAGAPKLTFIMTSGIWVHGDSKEPVSDLTVPGPAPSIVAWRIDWEQEVLRAREIMDIIIIRPGLLFGGSGSIFTVWLGPLIGSAQQTQALAKIAGKEDALLSLVHKDDLATAYVLFVEKAALISQISWPVFNVSTSQETLSQIIAAAARALAYKGKIEYVAPSNPFEEAMSTSVVFNGSRAKELLGWDPRHTSFTAGMDVYLKAIIAHL